MPEEEVVQQQPTAPQPEPQTGGQPLPEDQTGENAAEEAAAKEAEQKRKRLVTFLSAALLICLIAEVTLAAYIGLTLYQNIQNRKMMAAQYEAYVAFQDEQRQNPPKVQYIGPTVRVVDGVVVDNYAAEAAARAQAAGNIPGI